MEPLRPYEERLDLLKSKNLSHCNNAEYFISYDTNRSSLVALFYQPLRGDAGIFILNCSKIKFIELLCALNNENS